MLGLRLCHSRSWVHTNQNSVDQGINENPG